MDPARPSTMEASWSSSLLDDLEQLDLLDRLGDAVAGWLEPVFATPVGAEVKDFLHGRWLGHALHPVLSDLPIGFWTGSLVLDYLGAGFSAGVLSAAGSAAAVATAASGVADWTVTDGRERRLGLAHGVTNVAGLALQVASLGARVMGARSQARALGLVGWSVSTAAAYLGGELVFGRGLMVNHDAWVSGPQDWTPVLEASELKPGATAKVRVEGRAVLLYREGSRIHALENACTHAGGPLDEGEVRDGIVTCPWHGSRFRLTDGAVCRGPATYPQLRLLTRLRGGKIEVRGRQG